MRVRFTPKARRKFRRVRRLRLTLRTTVADARGNSAATSRKVLLRLTAPALIRQASYHGTS